MGEQEPFISELLAGLTVTIQDLESHQIHMFYEAVGMMIGADTGGDCITPLHNPYVFAARAMQVLCNNGLSEWFYEAVGMMGGADTGAGLMAAGSVRSKLPLTCGGM